MPIAELGLNTAVERFSAALLALSDEALARELPEDAMVGEGRWQSYSDVRDVIYRVYLELRELAVLTAVARERAGVPQTQAQRILAQHHASWRHTLAAVAGLHPDELDAEPRPGEWSIRTVLKHLMDAEAGFTWVIRVGLTEAQFPEQRPDLDGSGTLHDLLERYAAVHDTVLDEFAGLSDEQLDIPSYFWEGYPIEIRFRLHRFDAHLREHAIQIEKTLGWLQHAPSEQERLVRALHAALAEAEGAALGTPQIAAAEREHLAAAISRLAGVLVA